MQHKKIIPDGYIHESTRCYISDPRVAKGYDGYFAGQNLFTYDSAVLDRWFVEPGHLIDLGCGTGRLLVRFARRGFTVTGVDLSEHMLAEARTKLLNEQLTAQLIKADICRLPMTANGQNERLLPGSYDYALCMFSTIGLICGGENRLRFLRSVRQLLKPNGRLALHVHNKGFNIWRHEGRMFLLSNFIKSRLGLTEPGDKFLSNYRGIKGMYVHVFTENEITELLGEAGFSVREVLALNRCRDGQLKSGFLRSIQANGFLIRAGIRDTGHLSA